MVWLCHIYLNYFQLHNVNESKNTIEVNISRPPRVQAYTPFRYILTHYKKHCGSISQESKYTARTFSALDEHCQNIELTTICWQTNSDEVLTYHTFNG